MKKFFSFIIRQSVAVVLITLLVLGFGVYGTMNMSINLLPDINVPIVCVQTVYAGASASSVEQDVTVPIEDGLSSLSGVTDVESYSYENLSAVVLYFDYGTDTDEKESEINSKLSSISLPDGVSTTVYDLDLNSDAVAVLSVTSDEGLDTAYDCAQQLAAKISGIDGVESVEIKGGAEYYYSVQPFRGLELISPLIVEAFSYGALDLPLGTVTEDGDSVQLRNQSDVDCYEDILNMPIELPSGIVTLMATVYSSLLPYTSFIGAPPYSAAVLQTIESTAGMYLSNELLEFIFEANTDLFTVDGEGNTVPKDSYLTTVGSIATVEKEPSYTSYAYYSDGGFTLIEGTVVEVYKSNGANSAAVVENVKSAASALESDEGFGGTIALLDDQSEFISDSISNVLVSMIIGGVLAILIIFLFLKKVRTSLVIAITMPLSVLAALICLYLMGITLNMVSLGGLAVGIGMLVDNSIVVIECISKHRDAGKDAHTAAVDGTCEVAGALFGSTLTTICVFLPIIFSGGLTAEIFTDLSFAVIFSLAFSLIVAVTVIPALYAMFAGGRRMLEGKCLSPAECGAALDTQTEQPQEPVAEHSVSLEEPPAPKKKSFKERWLQPVVMDRVSGFYGKVLPTVLSHKLITIIVALVLFASSIALVFVTGTEFLPSIDKGKIEINMTYDGSGASLSDIQEDVLAFTEYIGENVDNIDYISASIGKNGLLALTDTGLVTVQLITSKNTQKTVDKIRTLYEEFAPLGKVTVKEVDGVVASLTSGSDDMSVKLTGADTETLQTIALEIEQKLSAEGFTDITDSYTEKATQYTLSFDRGKLAEYGIDYYTLVLTLRIGIASYTACTVTIDGESYNLDVSFADGAIAGKEDLEGFVIGYSGSTAITLKDVLEGGGVTEEKTETCIRRSNGNSVITVSAVLPSTDTGTATDKMESIAKKVLAGYEGYSFETSGISSYLNDAFSGLISALIISVVLLYAVMAIQFGSAVTPLIIMASIPFSFTGGFIALAITGTSLNVVSFIGLIMLMGVVVNNAIVMLEKIKQLHSDGMDRYEAVVTACKTRLRPILMTTLTTILALIPMAIGVGQGSELMQPLGIVVIGGLLIGTLVTLVLVPAVYCAVYRIKGEGKKRRSRNKAAGNA